jgi:hypothetical protein
VVTELGRVVEFDWTVMDLSFDIVRGRYGRWKQGLMVSTRPSAGMTRFRFKGHRTAGCSGFPRYLSPVGGTPLGDPQDAAA